MIFENEAISKEVTFILLSRVAKLTFLTPNFMNLAFFEAVSPAKIVIGLFQSVTCGLTKEQAAYYIDKLLNTK